MTFPFQDHYGYGILERDDLREDLVYTQSGAERVIPHLREGDVVRLQREGKTYGEIVVKVVEVVFDPVVADEDGNEYTLFKSWEHNLERTPWLRQDDESRGRVRRLTIIKLAKQQ